MATGKKALRDKAYYTESVKFIRDTVHGYVYLTRFDLELIDTPEFQRLKDVRQLTCQNVYPAARHTRFEHSLGVLELTRKALRHLNRNGILAANSTKKKIFDDHLVFNAALAALLHDVGHCPFSHMGEVEFDKGAVYEELCDSIRSHPKLMNTSLLHDFEKEKSGSTHERMSCIVIMKNLYDKLSGAGWKDAAKWYGVDLELIIRSIIGLPYAVSTPDCYEEYKRKNLIVELISSKIFDMDKLDYIMRDAISTGIGTPGIDTQRLFNNMYVRSEEIFTLIFQHRAVPVLQNMVEARDSLYMYVYNHHVTVFSDFMYSYIFRRLAHNAVAFQNLVRASIPKGVAKTWEKTHVGEGINSLDDALSEFLIDPISDLGIVPKSYLFSSNAILEQKRSDSDMVSLLHDIHYNLSQYSCLTGGADEETTQASFQMLAEILREEIKMQVEEGIGISAKKLRIPEQSIEQMISKIQRVFILIDKYQRREFLKPWWKTNFELTNFLTRNFQHTPAYKSLGKWVCNGEKDAPKGDEFRSQLAKHVIYIAENLYNHYGGRRTGLLEPLRDGDFFVIERSAHFLDKDTISNLNIALKSNEILGKAGQESTELGEYLVNTLATTFPQRDFYDIYEKNEFYIFSKQLQEGLGTPQQREQHYHLLEEIFVFAAKQLTNQNEFTFQAQFVTPEKSRIEANERESWEKLLVAFAVSKNIVRRGNSK